MFRRFVRPLVPLLAAAGLVFGAAAFGVYHHGSAPAPPARVAMYHNGQPAGSALAA